MTKGAYRSHDEAVVMQKTGSRVCRKLFEGCTIYPARPPAVQDNNPFQKCVPYKTTVYKILLPKPVILSMIIRP